MKFKDLFKVLFLCVMLALPGYSYANESPVEVVKKFIRYCRENNKAEAKKLCAFSTFDVFAGNSRCTDNNFDYLISNIGSFTQRDYIERVRRLIVRGSYGVEYKIEYSIASRKSEVDKNQITVFVDAKRMIMRQNIDSIKSKLIFDVMFNELKELSWTLQKQSGTWKIISISCYKAPNKLDENLII